ncbi:MAG TPA: PQQ-binding-like beta-propeller repeat protein [Vicinamibacterales bacterium]|nr:PQQ-binding-like beta-propeller repeat protein [Vicinamibacterales bacterium]
MHRVLFAGVAALVAAAAWHVSSFAQSSPAASGSRSAPTYTAAQASLGQSAYRTSCASCHGNNLDDGAFGPPLKGVPFIQKYGGRSVESLYTVSATRMPTTAPGSLPAPVYAQIVAYVLQQNAIVAGTEELPADPARLSAMTIPQGGFSIMAFSPYTPPAPRVTRPNPLDRYTAVTDEMLGAPASSEWLSWRRTWDAHGFSPLAQITKANVANLRVAWSWSLPPGSNEGTPLVHDGVLFVHGMGDRVQSLNAQSGDLLWEYRRQLPQGVAPTVKRGMALYRDRLYIGTSDANVIALDARTGKLVWDTRIGDTRVREGVAGGVLAARGKIMVGTTGTGVGAKPGGPQIVGLDAETGRIAWRVNTIAQPGQPGGESWNGIPIEKRSGASVWTTGSYEPTTGLAFFGTGNTYDTGPLLPPSTAPGVTNDALYTNTTLAIDPDTGRIVWHFQHHRRELWDLDWAFERQIVDLPVRGQTRRLVLTAGKIGIYDAVEAATGRFVFSIDLGLQNIVTAIDPETGEKSIDAGQIPDDRSVKFVCPHGAGVKNYPPASYNPSSKVVFAPLTEACMDVFPIPGGAGRGALSSGVNWGIRPRENSDGKYGRLEAINLETRKAVWVTRDRAPMTSGVLATAGGVVFAAAFDRFLRAFDDATGKVLWQTRLNDVSSAIPITYSVNGKQYLAVATGQGGFHAASYAVLVPELVSPPDRSAMLWVFELP